MRAEAFHHRRHRRAQFVRIGVVPFENALRQTVGGENNGHVSADIGREFFERGAHMPGQRVKVAGEQMPALNAGDLDERLSFVYFLIICADTHA